MLAVQLETNRALPEAIACTAPRVTASPPFNHEPYAQHWFEKSLSQPSAGISQSSAALS